MKERARGLASIKTAQRCRIRAKPKATDTDHLDLFLLEKNRSRIQEEILNVQERLGRLNKDIQDIDEAMAEINKTLQAPVQHPVRQTKKKLPRWMKNMDVEY